MTLATKDSKKKEPLDPAARYDLVKDGARVLFEYRGHVNDGNVIAVYGTRVDLVWLEGYKSRNETLEMAEILSVEDVKAPKMAIFPFIGNGHMLPAGRAWLAKNPPPADRPEFHIPFTP